MTLIDPISATECSRVERESVTGWFPGTSVLFCIKKQNDLPTCGIARLELPIASASLSGQMTLAEFINSNMEAILVEWEAFALTRLPAAASMSQLELRDHAQGMLEAIAIDLATAQTQSEQSAKSRGLAPTLPGGASAEHGKRRHGSGFDLRQLVSEYRALRATILRLWSAQENPPTLSLDEISRFNESMDQSLAESVSQYSDEVERTRDTFLAILGHDLRSPLNAVAMSSEYLKTGHLTGEHAKAVARIDRGVITMTAMIRDLLEFTKTTQGTGMPIALKQAHIGEIGQAAVDEMQAAYPDRTFHLETTGDLRGMFDTERLHQVLSNLLNNAIQHGASDTPVTLTVHGEADSVAIKVKNLGKVIPREAVGLIFNPWVQLTNDNSAIQPRSANSIGLGLFIAREIVEAHKGSIDVESTETEGTVFSARLPRGRIERRQVSRGR